MLNTDLKSHRTHSKKEKEEKNEIWKSRKKNAEIN
jgi:hypothetical protein